MLKNIITFKKNLHLHTRIFVNIIVFLFVLAAPWKAYAETEWPEISYSKDKTPISYEVFGTKDPTLVFVHGWSCDSRYWRGQIPVFSKKYRCVFIDLAGHGHSGIMRSRYTMESFGEDVKAVVESIDSENVILIGHSMGGSVIAEAARLMPDRVIGLIGIDTLENIEYPLTSQEFDKMTAPLKENFQAGCRQFVEQMLSSDTDDSLRQWILSDMSSAPPQVAMSAMTEMMAKYINGEAAKVFEKIRIPVVTVNGDLWPVNYEANQRHMFSFDAIIIKEADHFLMMNRQKDFNAALEKAIIMVTEKSPKNQKQ